MSDSSGAALAAAPDLTQCEIEPIHIPGSIQPHGALLALRGDALRVSQASASCFDLLGVAAGDLLGRTLADALGATIDTAVRSALGRHDAITSAPAVLVDSLTIGGADFDGHVHRSGDRVVLELEPVISSPAASRDALDELAQSIRRVRDESRMPQKAQVVAECIRNLTGYDRVMIYQYHEDWHGEVIAEARDDDVEPYLGHHFPASDIPSQARRMYLVSPTRVIADVEYDPSPLEPVVDPDGGVPLDLSRSLLRSVSPMHLEYLRNMQVRATLVASLMREGRMWGQVSCHHRTPYRPSTRVRQLIDLMAHDVSAQVALHAEVVSRERSAQLTAAREKITASIRAGTRLSALLSGPELPALLGVVAADGVALLHADAITRGGATPESAEIRSIVDALLSQHVDGAAEMLATECLSALLPWTAPLAATAAGVLMFPMSVAQPMRVVFFRGEQLRDVIWGGRPDTAVSVGSDGRLSPRTSFAAWTESVRLRSPRWRDEELKSAGEVAALVDVELRRLAQDAARIERARLIDAIAALESGFAMFDAEHRLVAFNDRLVDFERSGPSVPRLGMPRASLFPRRELEGKTSDGERDVGARSSAPGDTRQPSSVVFEKRVGDRSIRVSLSPTSDGGSVALFTDISELKRIQASLEAARDLAHNANRTKSAFLARMSHELRTPLNSIIGFTRQVRRRGGLTLPTIEQSYLARVEANGINLLALINDLLDLSKIEAGKLPVVMSTVRLGELVTETVSQLEGQPRHEGVALRVELPTAIQDISTDGDKLRQVLVNLVGNAVKFTRAGSVTVRVVCDAGGVPLRIDVTDTGVGIPADRVDAIFSDFEQADDTTARKYGGTGLGLGIARALCALLKMTLSVSSRVEEGSTFSIGMGALARP